MRLALVSAFLLAAAVFSGCSDDGAATDDATSPVVQYEDETIAVEQPDALKREPPAPGERTLAKAPEWRLGEWWRYRMTSEFTGETNDFIRVVAGSDGGNYLVGFPVDAFNNDVLVLHIPGYGDIGKTDLGFEAHDVYFQQLRFPLTDGDSWEVDFEGQRPGTAVVSVPGDGTAIVQMQGVLNLTVTYDPEVGEITKWVFPGYATYEIVEHGYNYQGVVRVPHDHDLVFQNGRFLLVTDLNGPTLPPTVAPPTETIELEGIYDRASFIIVVGGAQFVAPPLADVPTAVGVFQTKVTTPDGTVNQVQLLPGGPPLVIESFGVENPVGTWTVDYLAAGAGIAFIEGIAYHSIDVDLPSGCVVRSFNAQHHQAPCKIDASLAGQGTPPPV